MLTATLSADHRAVDGALVATVLGDLQARLESPEVLA
jgi:pyruvate/2-oxoglutarate dehydrogenase complex dihydrolipoamide acyltransferase (E2) component